MSAPRPKKLTPAQKAELQLMDDIGSLAYDPYGFVIYAFPWGQGELKDEDGPEAWQEEFLKNLGNKLWDAKVQKHSIDAGVIIREAIASGHGIGKTALVCWLILWAICTRTDTLGVVTANTETQLKTKTWSQLAKWHRLCICKHWFDLGATAIFSKQKDREKTWRVDQVPWSEQNPESFAGLHNEGKRILLIFDEASAIADTIWEVSEGAQTDQRAEIIWCCFGNPTRNTGRFKECFTGDKSKRWGKRQIDSRTCKRANKEQIQEWLEDYGEDSDFFKVRVRGDFPSASANQFIPVEYIDAAKKRQLREEQFCFAPKILTCDPAWTGDDELVIGLRQGLQFRVLRTMAKNDNDVEVAGILAYIEDDEQADAVFIDKGYGTGIWSCGSTWGRNWQLVDFGGKASDTGCLNKRAEMWNLMKKWLREGGSIPDNDKVIYNDLMRPETVPRMDGKIQLESKDDMKRRLKDKGVSPNRADALALSFAYPVLSRSGVSRMREQSHTDNSSPHYGFIAAQEQTGRQSFADVRWRH